MQLIIASDGVAGGGQQGNIPRPDTTVPGEELGRQRAEEARCATQALGIPPPILLGFPDGKLGDYVGDRALIYRVTQRIAEELARLRPDAVITWGPDGGTGHPDHRIVSNIVTQLQRAGAPGVPEHVFYMNLPVESMRAMNPQRGEPPLTLPQASTSRCGSPSRLKICRRQRAAWRVTRLSSRARSCSVCTERRRGPGTVRSLSFPRSPPRPSLICSGKHSANSSESLDWRTFETFESVGINEPAVRVGRRPKAVQSSLSESAFLPTGPRAHRAGTRGLKDLASAGWTTIDVCKQFSIYIESRTGPTRSRPRS